MSYSKTQVDTILYENLYMRNMMSSHIFSGCVPSINGGDNTLFDISAGVIIFVDNYTDPATPTVTVLNYAGSTGNAVTNLATENVTYLSLDAAGTIHQDATQIADGDLRSQVEIGVLTHPNKTTLSTADGRTLTPPTAIASSLTDLAQAVGLINVDTGNVYSPNGVNLKIDKSAGNTFGIGINYATSALDPNRTTDASGAAITFVYEWRDGAGGIKTNISDTVQPAYYDDDTTGSTTHPNGTVSTNSWTIMPIRYYPASATTVISAGQVVYNTAAEASAAIRTPVELAPTTTSGLVRGWLLVRGGATDLSLSTDAVFVEADKFGLY